MPHKLSYFAIEYLSLKFRIGFRQKDTPRTIYMNIQKQPAHGEIQVQAAFLRLKCFFQAKARAAALFRCHIFGKHGQRPHP